MGRVDNADIVRLAAPYGMLVKLKIGSPELGWIYCAVCKWGLPEGEDRNLWIAVLAQYIREPWACSPCSIKRRNSLP